MKTNVSNGVQIAVFTAILITIFFFFKDDVQNKFFNKKEPEVSAENIPAINPVEKVATPATSTDSVAQTEPVTQVEAVKTKAPVVVTATPKPIVNQKDLDAVAELKKLLAEIEIQVEGCAAGTLVYEDCASGPLLYEAMKECLVYKTSGEIEQCKTQVILKGFAGDYQLPSTTVAPVKEIISFQKAGLESELTKMVSAGSFQNTLTSIRKEFSVCDSEGGQNDVDCLKGQYVLNAIDSNCPKTDDIKKLNACIPGVLTSVEKMVNDYNKSL